MNEGNIDCLPRKKFPCLLLLLLLDRIHNKPFPYARLRFLVKELMKHNPDMQNTPEFKTQLNRWIDGLVK